MSQLKGLSKGLAWEYRLHRAIFLSGWYVRRGVNLRERVKGSPQTMGEVDILGVSYDVALSPKLLVGECKDRKGGAKEADRVVWLLGLKRVLGTEYVLFAKPKIADSTMAWARPFDVLLWDEPAVQAIERRFGLDPGEGYQGSFNPELEQHVASIRALSSPIGGRLRNAFEHVSGPFWYSHGLTRAKVLHSYFSVAAQAAKLPDGARDYVVAEGALAFLATLISVGGQFLRVSPARARIAMTEAFASGVASAAALREIAARADDYYRDALVRARGRRREKVAVEIPRLAGQIAQPPEWLGEYLELAARLAERPQWATDLLRYADLILFQDLVAGTNINETLIKSIATPTTELLRLLQLSTYFLARVWGVSNSLVDRLLALSPEPVQSAFNHHSDSSSAASSVESQLALPEL